jgi:formylglycine-generating enzyme required for sulfatase activity
MLLVLILPYGLSALAFAQIAKDESNTPSARTPEPRNVPFDAEQAARIQEAWARHLSADQSVKNSIGMQLILIPPGKFQTWEKIGIVVSEPFYLGQTEVTQAQWSAVMKLAPWKGKAEDSEYRSATFVSWNDAQAFCQRLTAQEKNGTYRLPTETQWEFACRAGTNTRYSFGDDAALLGQFAWISENSRNVGQKYAHDVALKKPNAFGLFDMHGNVWEYCDGAFTTDPTKDERPRPAKDGSLRVVAGGSWDADLSHLTNSGSAYAASNAAFYCRSDSRSWPIANYGNNSTGFRVAWSPPAKKGLGNSDEKLNPQHLWSMPNDFQNLFNQQLWQ